MTRCCIEIMRCTTAVPFQLVVVDTQPPDNSFQKHADVWMPRSERSTYVKDFNDGVDAAAGDFIVQMGNDIFTKPGWLEGLLECFERFKDCGAASLGAQEVGASLAHQPIDFITEGWYGPLMMWRKDWRLDNGFESIMSDSDLVMRLYQAGLRCYRNHKVIILHLNTQTHDGRSQDYQAMTERALQMFVGKWGRSPLWPAQMILRGNVQFGREFER